MHNKIDAKVLKGVIVNILDLIKEWEWVLVAAVGVIELVILWTVAKEKKERESLIEEIQATRIELGREHYGAIILSDLKAAEEYVYFVSHSLGDDSSEKYREDIYRSYKPSVTHRGITGADPGKIKYMWEQRRHGVDLKINMLVMASTFRFQVCDDRVTVLGFAERGDETTRKGIAIRNPFFSRVMRQHFLTFWAESTSFDQYVATTARSLLGDGLCNIDQLQREWCISEEERDYLSELLQLPAATTT
jgi:hypothetical protein